MSIIVPTVGAAASTSVPTAKLLEGWQGPFVVRPPVIALTPSDGLDLTGTGKFAHSKAIDWTRWGDSRAVGHGVLWFDTCNPDCAGGKEIPYRATIVASRVKRGRFTRLEVESKYRRKPLRYLIEVQPNFGGKYVLS